MHPDVFEKVFEDQVEACRNLLIAKGREYSTADDKLHNFKVAGELQKKSPAKALAGMMAKHTVSIYDMCESGQEFSMAQWNEKILDHLNYLFLLKACLLEHVENRMQGATTAAAMSMPNRIDHIPPDPSLNINAIRGAANGGIQL